MNSASSTGTAASDLGTSDLDSPLWSMAEVAEHATKYSTPCEVMLAAEIWKGFGPSGFGTVIMPQKQDHLDNAGVTFQQVKVARSVGGPWPEADIVARRPHTRGQMVTLRGRLNQLGADFTVDELQSAELIGAPGAFTTWRERQATALGLPRELATPHTAGRLQNLTEVRAQIVAQLTAGPNLPLMWLGREHIDAYGDVIAADQAVAELMVTAGATTTGPRALHSMVEAVKAATPDNCAAVVIARGGGCVADLAVFDDATLLQAIADCPVPTIVAIGHADNHPLAQAVATWAVAVPGNLSEALGKVATYRQDANLPVGGDLDAVQELRKAVKAARKNAAQANDQQSTARQAQHNTSSDNPWQVAGREAAAQIKPANTSATDTLIDVRGDAPLTSNLRADDRTGGRGSLPPRPLTIEEALDQDVEFVTTSAAVEDNDLEQPEEDHEITPEELRDLLLERQESEELRVHAAQRAETRCQVYAGAWVAAAPAGALLAAELLPWLWLDYLVGLIIVVTCLVRALMWWVKPLSLGNPVSRMARMNFDNEGQTAADATAKTADGAPEANKNDEKTAEPWSPELAEAKLRRSCRNRAIQLVVAVLVVVPLVVVLFPWGPAGKLLGVLVGIVSLGVAYLLVRVPTSLDGSFLGLLRISDSLRAPECAKSEDLRQRINQEYRQAVTIEDYNRARAEHRDLDPEEKTE